MNRARKRVDESCSAEIEVDGRAKASTLTYPKARSASGPGSAQKVLTHPEISSGEPRLLLLLPPSLLLLLMRVEKRNRRGASLVTLHVQGQVIGAREAAVAMVALEGLGARVLPVVSRQLV